MKREVPPRQLDRRLGEVEAGDAGAALGKAEEIGADTAADLQQSLPPERAEVDELRQITQLVESIVVEIVEEGFRADRLAVISRS